MNPYPRLLAFSLSLLLVGNVAAQDSWAQEPTDFMGMKFGASVTAKSAIPFCSSSTPNPKGPMCMDTRPVKANDDFHVVRGSKPDLGFPYSMRLEVTQGKIVSAAIATSSAYAQQLHVLLTTRYGEAKNEGLNDDGDLQSSWTGRDVSGLLIHGDEGSAMVLSLIEAAATHDDLKAREADEKAKANAKKL